METVAIKGKTKKQILKERVEGVKSTLLRCFRTDITWFVDQVWTPRDASRRVKVYAVRNLSGYDESNIGEVADVTSMVSVVTDYKLDNEDRIIVHGYGMSATHEVAYTLQRIMPELKVRYK